MKIECPTCKQHLEIDDQYAGMQATCPSCKTVFTIPKIMVIQPAEIVDTHSVEKTGSKIAVASLLCAIIAFSIQCYSNWLFIFYLPFYLVAFITAIVAICKRCVIRGILMIFAIIIMSLLPVALASAKLKVQRMQTHTESTLPSKIEIITQDESPQKPEKKVRPKIKSFLGQTFGNTFKSGTPQKTETEIRYKFTPEKPFRKFSVYFVYVTPKTNRIYKVACMAKIQDSNAEEKILYEILEDKFQPISVDQGISSTTLHCNGSRIKIKNILFSRIVAIECIDDELEKIAEREKIEMEKAKTDTSVL